MSGKTFAINKCIQEIKQQQNQQVKKLTIYPNALDDKVSCNLENCLFNKFDPVIGVWRDGLIPRFIRELENCKELGVLVLDGRLKSSWAENLNSLKS